MQSPCYNHFGSRSKLFKGHMTIFSVRSITFKPLERIWNNWSQMFTILRRCAEHILLQLWFKIKVAIRRGQRSYDFSVHLITNCFKDFEKKSSQMFTILRWCAERMLQPLWFKVKVATKGQRSFIYILSLLQNFWTT